MEDRSLNDKGFTEEYVEENIYWLFLGAGRLEELKNLVLSSEWVPKVLRRYAILQYERTVKDRQNRWKWVESTGEVDKVGLPFAPCPAR